MTDILEEDAYDRELPDHDGCMGPAIVACIIIGIVVWALIVWL